jgi:hypothetical protein
MLGSGPTTPQNYPEKSGYDLVGGSGHGIGGSPGECRFDFRLPAIVFRGSRLGSIRDPISYGHPGMTSPGEDAYAGSVSRPASASSLKPPAL